MNVRRPAIIRCPVCHEERTCVVDTRGAARVDRIRRRRVCLACRTRFSTEETIITLPTIRTIPVRKDSHR